MTISYITTSGSVSATYTSSTTTPIPITVSGVQAGDFIIAGLGGVGPDGIGTITPPSGWALISSVESNNFQLYTHSITAGEISAGSAAYTFVSTTLSAYNPGPEIHFVGAFVVLRSSNQFVTLDAISTPLINGGSGTAPGNVSATATDDWQVEIAFAPCPSGALSIGTGIAWANVSTYTNTTYYSGGSPPSIIAAAGSLGGASTATGQPIYVASQPSPISNFGVVGWDITVKDAVTPSSPTLISPANGSTQELATTPTFSWAYQSTDGSIQAAYAFRRKTTGAYAYWNGTNFSSSSVVWNTSGSQSVTFPASSWSDGTTYNWSVATQSSFGSTLQSGFATDDTVTGSAAPTVNSISITPSNSPTVVVSWSASTGGGNVQTAYQVAIYPASVTSVVPGTTPGAFYNSGLIAGSSQQATIGNVPNSVPMVAYVQITQTNGQVSTWASQGFTTAYDQPSTPQVAAVQATDSKGLPIIQVTVQAFENLLSSTDASLEISVGSWVAGAGTTISRSQNQALDGSWSLSIVRQ